MTLAWFICKAENKDNYVYMTDHEDSGEERKRLVAIDLESFIPTHNPKALPVAISHGSILGIPIVEPTEVEIFNRNQDL